jgi:hypothetical protein
VNDAEKNLEDTVKQGDSIYITSASNGSDAGAVIRDIIGEGFITSVEVNGKTMHIEPRIMLAGREVSPQEQLADRAELEITRIDTAREILSRAGYTLPAAGERDIMITVDSEPKIVKQRNYRLKVNNMEVSADFKVRNMDRMEYSETPSYFRIKDILKSAPKKAISVGNIHERQKGFGGGIHNKRRGHRDKSEGRKPDAFFDFQNLPAGYAEGKRQDAGA